MRRVLLAAFLWLLVSPLVMAATPCPPNLPNNPNAITVQGGDPTGLLGYPLAVVGACPFDVIIDSALGCLCVNQGTSPWIVGFGGVAQPIQDGTVGTANSTTTPLAANAHFVGTAESILGASAIDIYISTDVNSGPILLQWSNDGVHFDLNDQFAHTGITGLNNSYSFPVRGGAKFFRIDYQNDGSPQTVFRLQTIYRTFPTQVSFGHQLGLNGIWQPDLANMASTPFPSAARTARVETNGTFNPNFRGADFTLVVTSVPAMPGTGGLDLQIEAEAADGTTLVLNAPLATPIRATGTYRWVMYPGANATSVGGSVQEVLSLPLPPIWRVAVNPADAQSYTYLLDVDLQQ